MKKTQLRVFLKDHRGPVPLRTFLAALEAVLEAGGDVDRNLNGISRVKWQIAELQNGSAGAIVEGVPRSSRYLAATEEVVSLVKSGIEMLESNCSQLPRYFSERSFSRLRALANQTNRNLEVAIGNQPVTRQTVATIVSLTSSKCSAVDTIDGILDLPRVRGGKRFTLYDEQEKKIECFFPDHLMEDVRKGLGERVRVRGEVQFSPSGKPLSVAVQSIEILQPTRGIDLKSFLGIWDLAGPGEKYIRSIRDE
jgi:hypothetical protein